MEKRKKVHKKVHQKMKNVELFSTLNGNFYCWRWNKSWRSCRGFWRALRALSNAAWLVSPGAIAAAQRGQRKGKFASIFGSVLILPSFVQLGRLASHGSNWGWFYRVFSKLQSGIVFVPYPWNAASKTWKRDKKFTKSSPKNEECRTDFNFKWEFLLLKME